MWYRLFSVHRKVVLFCGTHRINWYHLVYLYYTYDLLYILFIIDYEKSKGDHRYVCYSQHS